MKKNLTFFAVNIKSLKQIYIRILYVTYVYRIDAYFSEDYDYHKLGNSLVEVENQSPRYACCGWAEYSIF